MALQSEINRLRKASVKVRPYCTGAKLLCMRNIVGDIEGPEGVAYVIPRLDMDEDGDGTSGGGKNRMADEELDWEEEKARLAREGMVCLPRCSLQQNLVQQSTAK